MIGLFMVVTRLYFEIPDNEGTDASFTIDLARELSKHHRRLIRQKQVFTVYGGIYQDMGQSEPTNCYVSTAPNFWVTKRAVNRVFKAWKKQISDTMAARNEINKGSSNTLRTGKWSDFKLLLDARTSTTTPAATGCYLLAKDAEGNDLPAGEWNYTTLTRPRPDIAGGGDPTEYVTVESDQFEVQIVGPHTVTTAASGAKNYTRIGAIESWLDSRPIPYSGVDTPDDNPDMITDPIHQMFAVGDSDEDDKIVEAINDENDIPPYDRTSVFGRDDTAGTGHGSNLQMQAIVSPDSNTGVSSVPGFQAICGLVRLHITGDTGSNGASLVLDVESNGVGF